jgi:hypothetical protein
MEVEPVVEAGIHQIDEVSACDWHFVHVNLGNEGAHAGFELCFGVGFGSARHCAVK